MQGTSEVLARKYRPKNFQELIGQETVSQTLSLALDTNRLSHAYLFSGLRGSGKTSTARIFAKALICQEGVSHEPCGKCQNCIMAIENRHMDIIEMDGASSRKIDDIRDLIEQTKYKPAVARYKIFIIDEVHMLTKEAFNALLKTLEEPPEYVKFILATTDPLKLPATILSRTQHFRFKSIAKHKVIEHLAYILQQENISYEDGALEILARSGGGSLRDTLTLLDQAIIFSKGHVDVATVTDMLGLVDPQFLENIFRAVFDKDTQAIINYTKELQEYESEMVVDELIAFLKEKMYQQEAPFSTLIIDRFFRILSESKHLFSINADGSFVLGMIFFKMVEALKIRDIDEMILTLQEQQATPQQTTPVAPTNTQVAQQEHIQTQPQQMQPQQTQEQTSQGATLFQSLVETIADRNYELGQCFEQYIRFISYEQEILTWESCADEECKKALKHGYGVIKQLVREIFGFNTQIKGVACSQPQPQPQQQKQQEQKQQEQQPPQEEITQSASTVEAIEAGGSASCVSNCAEASVQDETNGTDITKEPMVQTAIELFEAKKVTVQSKI